MLYVNKNSLSRIRQSYAGYLNTTVPEGGWGAYWENPAAPSVHDWTFPETARKYEIGGTSNYTGAIALGESLGLVNEIGIENIQEHIWALSAYCMDQLEAIGATIITHRDPGRRGGIVIARLYDDLDGPLGTQAAPRPQDFYCPALHRLRGRLPHLLPVLQQPRRHRRHGGGYEGAHPGDRTRPRLQSPLSPLPQQSRARRRKFRRRGSLPVEKFSTGEPFEPLEKVQKGV